MDSHAPPTPQAVVLARLKEAYAIRGSEVARSLEMAREALGTARALGDVALTAQCLNHVSLFCMIIGENQAALEAAKEAIGCFAELGDEMGIADAKYNIGSVYYKSDNYHSGLIHLVDALAIYRRHDAHDKVSRTYKTLGTIYEYFGDARSAISAYQQAVEAARLAGDLNLESNAYNPLSGIYLNQDDPTKATELIERSIAMKAQTGDVRGMAFALYGRAKVHMHVGALEEAERDFLEARRIHGQMGEKLGLGMVAYKLGVLYRRMGRWKQAQEILQDGRAFCEAYNITQFQYKCDYELYLIHKEQGDRELALYYLEAHLAVKESVINIETFKIIENYEHIVRQQVEEKRELMQAKELVERQNQALIKANAELDQYVYRASHDLRAPISSIMGLASIGRNASDLEEARRCFEMIDKRVQAQDHFIRQIVENAKNARLPIETVKVDLRQIVSEVVEGLFFMPGIDQVAFELDIAPGLTLRTDASRLHSILNNLIRNAVEYRDPHKPRHIVEVEAMRDGADFTLMVKDNGQGIPAERQGKIFQMFYRGNEKSMGSGLGLFIVQETVATLGGSLSFESKQGIGSWFKVVLPGH